jgi:hypothetical protein
MSCLCWKDLIYYIDIIMVAKQKIWIVVFWAVKFNPEDGSITFLQNADNHLQYHMASQHRRPQSSIFSVVRISNVKYPCGCFLRFAQVGQRL